MKKICYILSDVCIGEIVCRTMMYLLKKFRKSQVKSLEKFRKIALQSYRISKIRSGSCIIVERRESISCDKKKLLQVAPNCAALTSCWGLPFILLKDGGGYLKAKKGCFEVWLASYEMVEVEQKGSRPNTDY